MLKQYCNTQLQLLTHFFDKVDIDQLETMIEQLLACKGVIFFSGVGKSGFVAQKIAATLASTATKALYLSPMDALHGDIGIVDSNDIFVLISKSGDSEELIQLIPTLRNRGVTVIALVCKENCKLAKLSTLSIYLPLEKELCPFDLIPTTSTIIQMVVGDLIVCELMTRKNYSLDQYALNHPAGNIGKKTNLKVSDLMIVEPYLPLCIKENKIVDVLVELSNKKCGCILVVDDEMLLEGIFTDGDLRRLLQSHGSDVLDLSIQEVMTKEPRFIAENVSAFHAMKEMEQDQLKPVTVLPVLDINRKLLGLIKMHDILQSGI